jgi:hypothetical protein
VECQLDRWTVIDKAVQLRNDLDLVIATMRRDEADHHTPSSAVEPTTGGGPSDPTFHRAANPNPVLREYERDINRCRSIIGRIRDELGRKPRRPNSSCVNCGWKSATHPKSRPTHCEACDRFRRRNHYERPRDLCEAEKERHYEKERRQRRDRKAS